MTCAPIEDSDQPGHPPSLIRVFAVRMKKAWVLSYPLSAHRRLWSDQAESQADLSLRWAHCHFVGFVMVRLKYHGELIPQNQVALAQNAYNGELVGPRQVNFLWLAYCVSFASSLRYLELIVKHSFLYHLDFFYSHNLYHSAQQIS